MRDGPTKQNPIRKTIELPKPGQTIECKLTNDDDLEWRKLNVISRASKNKHLMNVALEQGELYWLDFEHEIGKQEKLDQQVMMNTPLVKGKT